MVPHFIKASEVTKWNYQHSRSKLSNTKSNISRQRKMAIRQLLFDPCTWKSQPTSEAINTSYPKPPTALNSVTDLIFWANKNNWTTQWNLNVIIYARVCLCQNWSNSKSVFSVVRWTVPLDASACAKFCTAAHTFLQYVLYATIKRNVMVHLQCFPTGIPENSGVPRNANVGSARKFHYNIK